MPIQFKNPTKSQISIPLLYNMGRVAIAAGDTISKSITELRRDFKTVAESVGLEVISDSNTTPAEVKKTADPKPAPEPTKTEAKKPTKNSSKKEPPKVDDTNISTPSDSKPSDLDIDPVE